MALPPRHRRGIRFISYILAWHLVMAGAVMPLTSRVAGPLKVWSSRVWNKLGVSSAMFPDYVPSMNGNPYDVIEVLRGAFGIMLIWALAGWISYRVLLRRYNPCWYRFVNYWWRSCLYATVLLPLAFLIGAMIPHVSFQVTSDNYADIDMFIFPPMILFYILLAPTFFALRELRSRGRRLWQKCPRCGYSLRIPEAQSCSECGVAIVKNPKGGWLIRR